MAIDIMGFPASPDLQYLESLLTRGHFVLKGENKENPMPPYPKAFSWYRRKQLAIRPPASTTPGLCDGAQVSSQHPC